jgi:ABC-type oligopeptide transport system ATPase subunit
MRRQSTREKLAVSSDGVVVSLPELEVRKIVYGRDFLPVFGERLSFFIAGPPGCGKSTTAGDILELKPLNNIFLFSDVSQDRAFEGVEMKRVIMSKDVLSKLTLDDLTENGDCWCVFDDIDKIRDPTVSKLTIALLDNIVANGRSHGGKQINVIVTSHALNDYRKTKYSLENCEYWVIFPAKTIKMQVTTLLKKIGLEKENLYHEDRLIIHHSVPLFIITSRSIRLL